MKNSHILALAVATALASAAAFAQTVPTKPVAKQHARIDANNDGVVDRAEAAKFPQLAAKFDTLDTNKDGKLSADERKAQQRGMRDRAKHGGMMAADTDKDGRISRAEAQAANLGDRFAQMDVNKDGYVDRADMQARMTQRRGECFTKADTDRNGQLSRAEFDKMGEACGPMRGGMKGHGAHPMPAKK